MVELNSDLVTLWAFEKIVCPIFCVLRKSSSIIEVMHLHIAKRAYHTIKRLRSLHESPDNRRKFLVFLSIRFCRRIVFHGMIHIYILIYSLKVWVLNKENARTVRNFLYLYSSNPIVEKGSKSYVVCLVIVPHIIFDR